MTSNLEPTSLKRTNSNIQPNSTNRKSQRPATMKLLKTSSVNLNSQTEVELAANNTNGGHYNYHHHQQQPRFIVDKSCSSSFRYKNILASRSVPILFILVCFLVIANTNCDQAGSTNEINKPKPRPSKLSAETVSKLAQNDRDLEQDEQQAAVVVQIKSATTSAPSRNKLEGLNVLREIYFDGNSKVTMLMPDDPGTVQKFHPNGRYGRRSVDNYAEQHDELGKLVLDDQSDSSRASGLPPMSSIVSNGAGSNSLVAMLRTISHDLNQAKAHLNQNAKINSSLGRRLKQAQLAEALATVADKQQSPGAWASRPDIDYELASSTARGAKMSNNQLELNKLLRCNYLGIANFFKCESAGAGNEAN